MLMFLLILLPVLGALLLPFIKRRRLKTICTVVTLVLEAVLSTLLLFVPAAEQLLFSMTPVLTVSLACDGISRLFIMIASWGFLLSGIFAFRYLEEDDSTDRFFIFFLLSLSALMGMDLSANLITMYLFFEMVTLLSMPLVLYDRSRESIQAALKYLFYSIAGAFLALGCIFFLASYAPTTHFAAGGVLDPVQAGQHRKLLEIVIFLGVLGFGVKAGLYPLHGWLPTAHPVAPAPASAVLSGIIAKAGVLAIIRVLFYCVGPSFLQGTWVQYAWIALALLTVFMGSMMAYREKLFKKRLAFSSVSQISYILTGLFFMTPQSVQGGLLHVLFHAVIKVCLFLTAGSFIHNTGKTFVSDYTGFGKIMPLTLIFYTLASLALIGIPPASGFISKWYLALGALDSELPILSWLAPLILLISALLTAGYLLPITVSGFFPGTEPFSEPRNTEGGWQMLLPIGLLSVLTLLLGLFSGPIVQLFAALSEALF